MSKPEINVTPLIDVLLVLLIIFMVVTPTKPSVFEAKIPRIPSQNLAETHPLMLAVTINPDLTLRLNDTDLAASVDEPQKLIEKLTEIFAVRTVNHAYAMGADGVPTRRIEKTVFIKAPRGLTYGRVAKIVDAVKTAGADPISLQIDGLD